MKRPEVPLGGQLIEARHLRSHAEAINDLDARLKRIRPGVSDFPTPSSIVSCPFGEIINFVPDGGSDGSDSDSEPDTKKGIRGGIVEGGDKIWNVEPYELELSMDVDLLVWLKLPVIANMDASKKVTLSGLKTSGYGDESASDQTGPTWEIGPVPDGYEDKVIPDIFPNDPDLDERGKGIAIMAIGRLTIVDGSPSLRRVGCGNFVITHCPGTLSTYRGETFDNTTDESR